MRRGQSYVNNYRHNNNNNDLDQRWITDYGSSTTSNSYQQQQQQQQQLQSSPSGRTIISEQQLNSPLSPSGANPQQAPIVSSPAPLFAENENRNNINNKGMSAFRYDMSDYSYYYDYAQPSHHNTNRTEPRDGGSVFQIGHNPNRKTAHNLLCCIFPWLAEQPKINHAEGDGNNTRELLLEGKDPAENTVQTPSSHSHVTQQGDYADSDVQRTDSKDEEDGAGGGDGDSVSTNSSNNFGEKLSDRDRQALLARLRLAQPEATVQKESEKPAPDTITDGSSLSIHPADHGGYQPLDEYGRRIYPYRSGRNGLLNGIPVFDTSPLDEMMNKPLRGILKRRSVASRLNDPIMIMKNGVIINDGIVNAINAPDEGGVLPRGSDSSSQARKAGSTATAVVPQRRSLFPVAYEGKGRKSGDVTKNVRFAPMARVVAVTSRSDMSPEEKGDIWWQRSDYEDFRRTGRIITRAMLEGGSEIWLSSLDSKANNSNKRGDDDQSTRQKLNEATKKAIIDEDKWWHKFGHSRRGLEHVVSTDEGKQRQLNVKSAIRAVLDEHSRQKMYRRLAPSSTTSSATSASNTSVEERLRQVSLHHTHWARDLALAAGASDADAVQSSFAADRRSREFYLLKLSKYTTTQSSGNNAKAMRGSFNNPQHHLVPQFMQPTLQGRDSALNMNSKALQMQQRLDANTAAQIRFRTRGLGKAGGTAGTIVSNGSGIVDSINMKNNNMLLSQLAMPNIKKDKALTATTNKDSDEGNTESATSSTAESTQTESTDDENIESISRSSEVLVGDVICAPLNDPPETKSDQPSQQKLSQKAAGFLSAGENTEKVNMAAVLSGMGVQ